MFKGGGVEVGEGEEKVEEIDANVACDEEAKTAYVNWLSRKTMSPRGTVKLETVHW